MSASPFFREDDGSALVIALIFIGAWSIAILAILGFAETGFDLAAGTADQRDVTYAAGGAVDAAIVFTKSYLEEGGDPADCPPLRFVQERIVADGDLKVQDIAVEIVCGFDASFDASVVQVDEETAGDGGPFENVNLDETTADNLLVAVSAYANDNQPIPTLAGWTLQGSVIASDGMPRSIAVYTKLAEGGDESISLDWCVSSCADASLLVAEIEADGETLATATFTGTAGGNDIEDLTVEGEIPAGSAVVISGLVVTDGSQTVTWTVGVTLMDSNSTSSLAAYTGFAEVGGPGSFGATADWADNLDATGFVLVMSP